MYLCNKCGKSFTRESSLKRHIQQSCKNSEGPTPKKIKVEGTAGTSASASSFTTSAAPSVAQPSTSTGIFTSAGPSEVMCNCCNKPVLVNSRSSHLRTLEHRTNACVDYIPGVQLIQSAFRYRIVSFRVFSENHYTDFNMFFESIRSKIILLLLETLKVHKAVKVNMELFARYILQAEESQESQETTDVKSFNTTNKIIDESTDLDELFDLLVDLMINQTSEFQERGSGMTFFWLTER